jgi:membrane protein implicated in regulation of membrane protease activity
MSKGTEVLVLVLAAVGPIVLVGVLGMCLMMGGGWWLLGVLLVIAAAVAAAVVLSSRSKRERPS